MDEWPPYESEECRYRAGYGVHDKRVEEPKKNGLSVVPQILLYPIVPACNYSSTYPPDQAASIHD